MQANFKALKEQLGVASDSLQEEVGEVLLHLGTTFTWVYHIENEVYGDDNPDLPYFGVVYFPTESNIRSSAWRPVMVQVINPTVAYNETQVTVFAMPADDKPLPTLEQLVAEGCWG